VGGGKERYEKNEHSPRKGLEKNPTWLARAPLEEDSVSKGLFLASVIRMGGKFYRGGGRNSEKG